MIQLNKIVHVYLISTALILAMLSQINGQVYYAKRQLDSQPSDNLIQLDLNAPRKYIQQDTSEKFFHFKRDKSGEYFNLSFRMLSQNSKIERVIKIRVEDMSDGEIYQDKEGEDGKSQTIQIRGELKAESDYRVSVLILDEIQLRYEVELITSDEYLCTQECYSNGECNQNKQLCQCDSSYIGQSCSVQSLPLSYLDQSLYSLLRQRSTLYYSFKEHFTNLSHLDSIHIIILLPQRIQQQYNANFYLSQGYQLPLPSQSFDSYINPFDNNPKGVFRIIVGKEYLYNKEGEPIPINLSVISQSDTDLLFFIQLEVINQGIAVLIYNRITDNYIFIVSIIALLLAYLSYYCLKRRKQQQFIEAQQNKAKENHSFSHEIVNYVEQKNIDVLGQNSKSIDKNEILNSIQFKRNIFASPRGNLCLIQIKTLSLDAINMFMPVQLYNNVLNSQIESEIQIYNPKVDQNNIITDTSPHPQQMIASLQIEVKESDCFVCKQPFKLQDHVRNTICSHIIHDDCLMFWLQREEECPKCKQSLSKISLYQNQIDKKL